MKKYEIAFTYNGEKMTVIYSAFTPNQAERIIRKEYKKAQFITVKEH